MLSAQFEHEIILRVERTEPPHYFCGHTVLARYLWPKLLTHKVHGASLLAGKEPMATLLSGHVAKATLVYRQSICGCTLFTGKVFVAAHC
jgi:hypothetical protein